MFLRITTSIILVTIFLNSNIFGMDKVADEAMLKSLDQKNELIKTINPSLYKVTKQWDDYFKEKVEERSKKTPVFFYFFTIKEPERLSANSLQYFNAIALKLKEKHPEIRFTAVMKGFPEDTQALFDVVSDAAKKGDGKKAGIKIHFYSNLFDDLNIQDVPAFAYAECEEDYGGANGCDFKYLVRGNVGLDGFIDMMSDKNPIFKELAHDAREAK